MPILLMTAFVINECLHSYMPGPMEWTITDALFEIYIPSMWLDSWRFWWIGTFLKLAMNRSVLIIYLILLGRWISCRIKNRIES